MFVVYIPGGLLRMFTFEGLEAVGFYGDVPPSACIWLVPGQEWT